MAGTADGVGVGLLCVYHVCQVAQARPRTGGMRILFIHNSLQSFVRVDRDILASAHEVDELDLSRRMRVMSLPARMRQADLVFAWFAGVHSLLPILAATIARKPSIVVVGGYDTANLAEIGYGHMKHPWKR